MKATTEMLSRYHVGSIRNQIRVVTKPSMASYSSICNYQSYKKNHLNTPQQYDHHCSYKNMNMHLINTSSNQSSFFSTSSSNLPQQQHNDKIQTTSSDGVVATPINFDIASTIEGNESQILTVQLRPNEALRAESGAMMYMTEGIEMNTTAGGGISAGFKRMLTGQNIFISDYSYKGQEGTFGLVCLGTDFPSKILRLSVDEYGGKIVCQKGALLCASHTIDIEMEFTKKFSTGFFGGEGFVLQGLVGSGDVFVKAGGTLIRKDLEEGEELKISSGCLVAFAPTVEYDIQMMKGFKNVLFGGEGLFVTTLTGPGPVWLQGQPPQRMISEIARRVPSGGGLGVVPVIGGGGGGDSEDGGSGDSSEEEN